MPAVTSIPVAGFAFCPDPRCPGNKLEPVDVMETRTELMYTDMGGDMPGIERTTIHLRCADETRDGLCPACGRHRTLTDQPRIEYPALSGHRQDGLLNMKAFDPAKQAPSNEGLLMAEMMRQVAELRSQLAAKAEAPPEDPMEIERQEQIKAKRLGALAHAREVKAQKQAESA